VPLNTIALSKVLRYGNTQFYLQTCHTCLYSPAAEHHRPLAGTHFTVPQRVEGWVDLGGWLHTEIKCHPWESNLDTVTHPSTNWAQRRLTSLIETNALPLRQTANYMLYGMFLHKESSFDGRNECTCVEIFSGVNFLICTTIKTTDEFRNVRVIEVGMAGWAWSLHRKQTWIGNCK